jgi:hypothetical protein
MSRPIVFRASLALSVLGAAVLASCGGGDSPAPVSSTVTGSVVKGPVNGATVCAFRAVATGKGDQIKCTTTTSTGAYTLDMDYAGDVVIEATGGTYTDEATGASASLTTPMQVVVNAQGTATVGVITPLTAAAFSVSKGLAGGVSSANFASAANTVATQFQLPGVNLATTLPSVTGTLNDYGRILRAVSQYVANGNTLASFVAFNTPQTLQTGFATAYATANGSTLTFTFPGGTISVTPGDGGGTGGGSSTGGGSTGGGTESCGITVSGSGSVTTNGLSFPFSLPPTKVCVTGIPAGACAAGNSTLQSLAAGGATPAGNYSISYQYSYAANDCSGALFTVNYTR